MVEAKLEIEALRLFLVQNLHLWVREKGGCEGVRVCVRGCGTTADN